MDEILWCHHSNETSSAVLLHGTICFSIFYKMKFGIFLEYFFIFSTFGNERVTTNTSLQTILKKSVSLGRVAMHLTMECFILEKWK